MQFPGDRSIANAPSAAVVRRRDAGGLTRQFFSDRDRSDMYGFEKKPESLGLIPDSLRTSSYRSGERTSISFARIGRSVIAITDCWASCLTW